MTTDALKIYLYLWDIIDSIFSYIPFVSNCSVNYIMVMNVLVLESSHIDRSLIFFSFQSRTIK